MQPFITEIELGIRWTVEKHIYTLTLIYLELAKQRKHPPFSFLIINTIKIPVILARVKRERIFNSTKVYKVRVKKEYKMTEKAAVALKSGQLITAEEGSMCGVDLIPGKTYAIAGNIYSLKARINLCGLNTPWEDLTRRQRKGLRMIYKQGCTCKINSCRYRRCTMSPDSCNYTSDCHMKEVWFYWFVRICQ